MRRLEEAGYRSGAARREVVDSARRRALCGDRAGDRSAARLGRARERLPDAGSARAAAPRARVEIGGDAAGYERVDPEQHHHHLVCEECGRLSPFADPSLERAIEAVSRAAEFEIAAHDVVLRGRCPDCKAAA